MIETVFLVVLIISLVIGNILLYFIPSKGNLSANKGAILLEKDDLGPNFADSGSNVLSSNLNALNSKINLLAQQVDSINQKVKKFDHFRANSAVELTAIREILTELQNKYIVVPAKQKKTGNDISAKELHKIIYRSK